MGDSSPTTIKDIAQALKVSVATVSRALKDSPLISKEKRERIKQYAQEHNFTPNTIASGLRHSKTKSLDIIGVIVPQYVHYYFSQVLTGIDEVATKNGYRIMVAQSGDDYEREVNICREFLASKVCGIIVSQAKGTRSYDHFEELMGKGVPLVFYDRISTGINASRVVVDDYDGAYNAVNHLIQSGCRRIAFYGTKVQLEISKNRHNGYRDALLKNGLSIDDSLYFQCDDRFSAESLTAQVLQREDRPDAFLCVNDETAIGVLYTSKRLGLRVPEDISICGFTNGNLATACDPMLTTVEQRGTQLGIEAANILIRQSLLPNKDRYIEKKVVRTRLVVRGTTK